MYHSRFPWEFGPNVEFLGCAALALHTQLVPFMYSLGFRYHIDGVQPVRPLYYLCPEDEDAYNCPSTYVLGDDVIVSPIITPINKFSGVATTAVWLPSGRWFDFQTGREYAGGWHLIAGDLSRTPVFVRAGGFLPMEINGHLTVHVFPAGSRSFNLYEDDGLSSDERFHITKFSSVWEDSGKSFEVKIESAGDVALVPQNRTVALKLHNLSGDATVKLTNCQALGPTAMEEGCLVFDIRILDYPATVAFGRERALVVKTDRPTMADIYDLLYCSSLEVHIKKSLFEALRECEEGPDHWAEVIANLISVPLPYQELLYGVLCDFGVYHFTKEMGRNVVVAWNTSKLQCFTYVSDVASRTTPLEKNTQHERVFGLVPDSIRYDVEKHRTRHDHSHILDLATRQTRLEFRVFDIPAFAVDFDKL
jgi:hypothetical protein